MNKILDKLGLYDLIAVLLSGISILTISIFVLQYVYKVSVDIDLMVSDTLTFFVFSYFVGLIFQEFTSLIQKKLLYKDNALLKSALCTEEDSHTFLTKTEKDRVYSYVINQLKLNPYENNDNIIYNYCKFKILKSGNMSRMDRDQSISAMSRSFSLYFFMLTILFARTLFVNPSVNIIILTIVSFLFTILFYYRCIRFTKLRYINIIRTFYYNFVSK